MIVMPAMFLEVLFTSTSCRPKQRQQQLEH
jgi:hypothetical protein